MKTAKRILNSIKDMDKIETDRNILKRFGIAISACLAAITLVIFLKHRHSTTVTSFLSFIFLFLAFNAPLLLKYPYIAWMRLASILGWLNTRLLLAVVFYFIFSPVGLVMRLFGIDLLERKFDRAVNSYWKYKEKRGCSPVDYERQS